MFSHKKFNNKKNLPSAASALITEEEKKFFRNFCSYCKPLKQDTVYLARQPAQNKQEKVLPPAALYNYFIAENTLIMPYCPPATLSKSQLYDKKYQPQITLDLHGYNQQQAKSALLELLYDCLKNHWECICVIHGHGKNILKQQVPLWLAQHPNIDAFYQAPKSYGGNAALLILIKFN